MVEAHAWQWQSDSEETTHRARWVLPITAPPIEHGLVRTAGPYIVEVRAASPRDGKPTHDWGDAALLPSWVNPHTHLEFSHLTQRIGNEGIGLAEWIEQVVAWRRSTDASAETDRRAAVASGWEASRRSGVAAVGEIAGGPGGSLQQRYASLSGIVFLEAIGLQRSAARAAGEALEAFFAAIDSAPMKADGPAWGVSPHAPYTVRPELFARLCRLAATRRLPLAMHLAESREELSLLQSGTGPLVDTLQRLDAWDAGAIPHGTRPLDYLHSLVSLPRVLIAHGNYLARDEWEFVARHHRTMSVVYCPRTHAYFRHALYPLGQALRMGACIAVGTDSMASSPDLSILEELRCVRRRHPDLCDESIVRMGTVDAARALGLENRLGRLAPGFAASLVALPLDDPADPWSFLWGSETAENCHTVRP